MKRLAIASAMLISCSGKTGTVGDDGGDDMPGDPMVDAADPVADPCATPVQVPTTGRALDLMPAARLAAIAARVPCVPMGPLRDILESKRTLWYDKKSLIPG